MHFSIFLDNAREREHREQGGSRTQFHGDFEANSKREDDNP